MKRSIYLIAILTSFILLQGCSSFVYQIYEAKLPENVKKDVNNMYYEDENCKISYDLWSNGGAFGFAFYNKSDKYIYLNLEETFFIKNGIAYDYYKKRSYSSSQTLSSINSVNNTYTLGLVGATNSILYYSTLSLYNSNSVSFEEKNIICIPPHTSRYFSEYKLTNSVYKNCDINSFPGSQGIIFSKNKKANTISFEMGESPLTFGNIVSYGFDRSSKDLIRVENNFYINSITNYEEKKITQTRTIIDCDNKYTKDKYFKNDILAPNKFYIKYNYQP